MAQVIAEWGGRRYPAKVDGYGGALIIGGPIVAVQNEGEKAMANEQPEVLSVAVTEVVEKLLERQTALEAKGIALEAKVAALEHFGNLQQLGLEKLSALVDAHQRLFEAQVGYVPPDPAKAASN